MKEAVKILFEANNTRKIVNRQIEVFRKLVNKLGNPEKSFKSIHITGTNGKGSVAIKTAAILQRAGYKTGLYTSPHLFTYLERIKVNRQNIDEKFFSHSIMKIHDIAKKNNLDLTFFQYLTASGFLYFKEQQCDFASIQVGLGGRYDTTNVITPEISVITSIGLDHQKLLGNTRQQIAKDKAGIIKQGVPVVVGPRAYMKPIIEQAKSKNAPLSVVEESPNFEEENNKVTQKIIQTLKAKGYNIPQSSIDQGLQVRQPCRMQQLPKQMLPPWASHKRLFFDVGHNPQAIQRMIEYYETKVKKEGDRCIILYGASKQKDVDSALRKLQSSPSTATIFFVQANHFRAKSVHQISNYVGISTYPHKFHLYGQGNIEATLQVALAEMKVPHVIVCGSFFMMPQAWGFFDKKYLNEELNMQEVYQIRKNK